MKRGCDGAVGVDVVQLMDCVVWFLLRLFAGIWPALAALLQKGSVVYG
jgi:hypothetical protein